MFNTEVSVTMKTFIYYYKFGCVLALALFLLSMIFFF